MTELLSPAGGREALAAAVQNGADAVYMGFGSFNARRSARNFSDEEFLAAVRYCHLWGVKVYLTLNTLVTDRELPALAETGAFTRRCAWRSPMCRCTRARRWRCTRSRVWRRRRGSA